MPKIALGQWAQKDEQFIRNLKAELCRKGKNYKNLMRRTGTSQGAVYKRYREPETMTVLELRGYIQEAGLSEDDVLDFLFKDRG